MKASRAMQDFDIETLRQICRYLAPSDIMHLSQCCRKTLPLLDDNDIWHQYQII